MSRIIRCTMCAKEISSDVKVCPHCGAKNKKPLYKRPWFIILVAFIIIGAIGNSGGKDSTLADSESSEIEQEISEDQTSDETLSTQGLDDSEDDVEDTDYTTYSATDSNTEYEEEIDYIDEAEETAYSVISSQLGDPLKNTTLDSLRVNENAGTDSDEDVIVLANLSWSTKNREELTREMLKMYSDHLAAKLAPKLADGSEIALFWEAEYTGLDIKHSYYIENGNAYIQ